MTEREKEKWTIYKYPLETDKKQEIKLLSGSKILKIGKQKEDLFLWVLQPKEGYLFETRIIVIYGTGWEIEESDEFDLIHIDSIFDDEYVWHVFEETLTNQP